MKYIADRRASLPVLLTVAAVMQLPAVFFGFELCDSGFYMTFYDNIFSHPEAVGYNFMYYLSGVAGGAVSSLTGGSILAMRLFGAVCNLLCVCCVWSMTRECRSFLPMLLTVILVTAGAWGTPLTFYNDIMTILLTLLSLTALTRGLETHGGERRRLWLLFVSGAVAGINTLTRIPNVLEIAFAAIIPLSATEKRARLTGIWLAGWLSGLAAGLLFALAAGHLTVLADTMRDLATTAATPGTESSHGMSSLIQAQISSWTVIGKMTLKLIGLGVIYRIIRSLSERQAADRPRIVRAIRVATTLILYAAAAWMLLRADIMTSLTAVALFGCLLALQDKGLRLPATVSLFMVAILPLGSDNGIYNAGTIMLWSALAVSLTMSCRWHRGIITAAIAILLTASCTVSLTRGGTYFDDTPLRTMTAEIDAPTARGIRTSDARARRVNTMLRDLRRHVSPGDTLLLFGSAPMINHLTSTVPAIGCSWPELLSPALLQEKLDSYPPASYIMILRFRTLGPHWCEPSQAFADGEGMESNRFHSPAKSEIMNRYIEKNGYRPLIESEDFTLFKRNGRSDRATDTDLPANQS